MRYLLALLLILTACQSGERKSEDAHKHGDSDGHGHHDGHGDAHRHGHGGSAHGKAESGHNQTTLTAGAIAKGGFEFAKVAPATLLPGIPLPGRVHPSEHRIAHVIPRFPGVVREGRKHVGDSVEKGEVLAIIESNQSLQPYEIRSQIAGTVIDGHLILGEYVPENETVFVIADISEVWVDVRVPAGVTGKTSVGQRTEIRADTVTVPATIDYIAPYLDDLTQTRLIRAVVANPEHTLLPGMFVTVNLVTEEIPVPIAVDNEALHRMNDVDVIFTRKNNTFHAREVRLGRSDGRYTEVLSGVAVDSEYVTRNSFIIKADILKSEAGHDH